MNNLLSIFLLTVIFNLYLLFFFQNILTWSLMAAEFLWEIMGNASRCQNINITYYLRYNMIQIKPVY